MNQPRLLAALVTTSAATLESALARALGAWCRHDVYYAVPGNGDVIITSVSHVSPSH